MKFWRKKKKNFLESKKILFAPMIDSLDMEIYNILNAGELELLDLLGNDLDIVNAAKVSFASYESQMTDSARGLLRYLVVNKHATPFEHVIFKFRVKAPIFVAREWFRHRWSSFNEVSMRYHVPKQLDFYLPEVGSIRTQVGKPGAYKFETIEDEEFVNQTLSNLSSFYESAEKLYKELIQAGLAKELARVILPVGQYTEFIWTVNLRSLINFLSLRNSELAQLEISEYANFIENIFEEKLPVAYWAWLQGGREAL